MKPLRAVALAFVVGTGAASAVGATTPGQGISIHSFSDASCGAWASAPPEVRQVHLFWFRGFVSGFNFANANVEISLSSMPDNETLVLYVDKYCRDNPLRPFVAAAFKLVEDLPKSPKSSR